MSGKPGLGQLVGSTKTGVMTIDTYSVIDCFKLLFVYFILSILENLYFRANPGHEKGPSQLKPQSHCGDFFGLAVSM